MRGLFKFLTIMAVLGALYYIRYYLSYWQVEKHSLSFVTDAVNDIGDKWDVAAFEKLADNSLKSSGTIKSTFASYEKIGPLVKPASCELQDFTTQKYQGTTANYISATYGCKVEFKNGSATIQVVIVRFQDKDEWKIFEFDVFSPFFSAGVAEEKPAEKPAKP